MRSVTCKKDEYPTVTKTSIEQQKQTNKLRGFSPQANYTVCVSIQQLFYCCYGDVFTKPLPIKGGGYWGIHRLTGGIYDVQYGVEMGSGVTIL
jgi:hypothetical protein